jgi:hypothetical protein
LPFQTICQHQAEWAVRPVVVARGGRLCLLIAFPEASSGYGLSGERLKTSVERALRQYVSILAGQTDIVGVDLQGAQTPLVQ